MSSSIYTYYWNMKCFAITFMIMIIDYNNKVHSELVNKNKT